MLCSVMKNGVANYLF